MLDEGEEIERGGQTVWVYIVGDTNSRGWSVAG
jgi:hypothetical protein